MPVPAANGLTDFGAETGKALVPAVGREEPQPAVAQEDMDGAGRAGEPDPYAEGFQAGRDEVSAELQAIRQEFDARLEGELDKARQDWAEERGGLAAQEIAAQFAGAQSQLREWMGETAKVMLEGVARERALDELHDVIAQMMERRAVAVKAFGPEEMLHALRSRVSGEVGNLTCTPQPHGELRVEIDRTVVETTTGAWLDGWSRRQT